jgi:hypothetical protein
MKLALIFLSIFVAISHQQYFHPRMMFGFPWMSPFAQQPMAFNDYVWCCSYYLFQFHYIIIMFFYRIFLE